MFPVVWVRVGVRVLKLGTRVLRVRVPSTQAPTLVGSLVSPVNSSAAGSQWKPKSMTRSECSRRANWTPSQTMSRGHSQMDRSLMKNSALSSMRPKNIPRWRQRSALVHRKLMLQSLSMRRQKTPSSNRAETRPGRVSWRSWLGPELCVPKEHLDAGMLLRMRQREREGWPAPVEPLGRRGGGPSSQGLLVFLVRPRPTYTFANCLCTCWELLCSSVSFPPRLRQ